MDPNIFPVPIILSYLFFGSNVGTLVFDSISPYRPTNRLNPWYFPTYVPWLGERYHLRVTVQILGPNQIYVTQPQPNARSLVSLRFGDRMVSLSSSLTIQDVLNWNRNGSRSISRIKIQRSLVNNPFREILNYLSLFSNDNNNINEETIYDTQELQTQSFVEGINSGDIGDNGVIEDLQESINDIKRLDLRIF